MARDDADFEAGWRPQLKAELQELLASSQATIPEGRLAVDLTARHCVACAGGQLR